jgi:uncharacterized oligopeptide transporter (OPT) family protein
MTTPRPGELTLQAVLAGCLIGAVLAIGNVYMSLKTGWGDSGNLTAAVVGFAVMRALRRSYSQLENNITQTTAASAASMPFTIGLMGAFPALTLMGHAVPAWSLPIWGLCLSAIGIGMGVALRKRLIVEQDLPFPSGIATAEVITAMHTEGARALGRARALAASACLSAVAVWLRDAQPAWIPRATLLKGAIAGIACETLALGISWSPMLVGTGVLIGPRNGISVLAGGLVAWSMIAPAVAHHGLVAPTDYEHFAAWLLWPGVSLMTSAALASLSLEWQSGVRALRDLAHIGRVGAARLAVGVTVAGALVVLGRAAFGLSPLVMLFALGMSLLLATVCARATGETDIAPVTQMGQITQIAVGSGLPSLPTVNVLAASAVAGVSTQASGLLWAFRAGQRLSADPRRQVFAQLAGAVTGALVVVPVYFVVVRAYGLGNAAMPAPAALAWKALSDVLRGGASALPQGAGAASLAAVALGIALAAFGRTRVGRFLPSAVGMGIGFLTPASFCIAIGVGSLLYAASQRCFRDTTEAYGPAIASGVIAGESLCGVAIALLLLAGVLP